MRTHDVSLWNGNDTSLSTPTTAAVLRRGGSRSTAGGNTRDDPDDGEHRGRIEVDGGADGVELELRGAADGDLRQPRAAGSDRPRDEDRSSTWCCRAREVAGGLTVKTLSTQAGELPLIPEWALPLHGHSGQRHGGAAGLHRDRRPDRVPLADRREPASLPAGNDRLAGSPDGGGEVRRRGGEGRGYAHSLVNVTR